MRGQLCQCLYVGALPQFGGQAGDEYPFFLHHSELLTRALLITSLVLFLAAVMAILFRWLKGGAKNETSHD